MINVNRSHFKLVILFLTIFLAAGVAAADGQSPAQLSDSGWTCMNAGHYLRVHCFPPGTGHSANTINIKVFETTDIGSDTAEYLGTELLIHADVYNQQGCPQEDLDLYEDLYPTTGMPYYACHHFDDDHH